MLLSLSLSLSSLFSEHTPPENLPLPNTIADQFACSAPDTDNDVQTAPAHLQETYQEPTLPGASFLSGILPGNGR
jgi:hypothetical protein